MIALILVSAVVVIAVLLLLSKGWLTESLYRSAGKRIDNKLNERLSEKYSADLNYTLDKFWEFYEKDIVNRNDLTDVVDKMKRLAEREEIKDREIFDFITYVSRIYTDAMHEYHKNHPYFQPPEPDTVQIDLNQI
jgi:ABC-type transporter MlaC component